MRRASAHPLCFSLALGMILAGGACNREPRGPGAVPPGCGDGLLDDDEECDEGVSNSDVQRDACRTDCLRASCGDGIADTGEQCDDANAWGGDGCTPACTTEDGQLEVEENDFPSTGNIWRGGTVFGATPEGDRDCFIFPLPQCAAVQARLVGDCREPATLTLFDPTGYEVAAGGPGADGCAVIDPAETPGARFVEAGTWALCVNGLASKNVHSYALRISIVPPEYAAYTIPVGDDPDGDGRPAICDDDRDGDGVLDEDDNCPDIPNGPEAPTLAPTDRGFIRQWLTIGPFTGLTSDQDCRPTDDDLVATPDATVTPAIGDLDLAGVNPWIVMWRFADHINLRSRYGGAEPPREAYMAVYVYSETTRDVTLAIGPDDGARVWLNATEVMDISGCQGASADRFTQDVTLNAGWNPLVMKIYDQYGGWGNYVRFLDSGVPVTDLGLSLSPDPAWVPDQTDSDGDGVGDVCDTTPL